MVVKLFYVQNVPVKMINLFNILHITMHSCRWVTAHVAIPAESQRSHPYLSVTGWGVINGGVVEDGYL